ncbi:MAG: hypothetical protein CMM07_13625 [Rhodopirellula sp.]|nr:hypothetical protein [Rhodopirellula sp.]
MFYKRSSVCLAALLLTGICLGPHNRLATAADINLASGDDVFTTEASRSAAVLLGKALFWDEQLGSGNGGQYACASCHYQAGADSHPLRIEAGRLPNGIMGSLGVQFSAFNGIAVVADESAPGGLCAQPADDFGPAGEFLITGRNAPPSVDSNSVHNFWDGRANFIFNGIDPSGEERAELYSANGGFKSVSIGESSQASQAVGPPNSDVEMAAQGRSFAEVGFKLCHVVPLCRQTGDIVEEFKTRGLYRAGGYIDLIEEAFGNGPLAEFVSAEPTDVVARVCVAPGVVEECPCSITEANFALFFGLAIQAYEQTLVTVPAKMPNRKMKRAFKELRCNKCHYEDGRSHAVTNDLGRRPFDVTGVAPLAQDPGVTVANLNLASTVPNDEADADVGSFKSSHLFNLPLTAPYFHDGSEATIPDMVDFYIRGGNHDLGELSSQIRTLDASKKERRLVIKMMERLTDPRIAAGTGPYSHPSLTLPLGDGTTILLRASDDPAAIADTEGLGPGLSYDTTR